MRSNTSFSVYPRYSCGSPGLVDEVTATRVAQYELWGHQVTLEGIYGEEKKKEAHNKGLSHIIEQHVTYANHIAFTDLLTGEYGEIRNGKRTITGKREPDIVYHDRSL